jgi:hypothetical protein
LKYQWKWLENGLCFSTANPAALMDVSRPAEYDFRPPHASNSGAGGAQDHP